MDIDADGDEQARIRLVVALVGLALFAPLFVIAAILIKLDSPIFDMQILLQTGWAILAD